MVDNKGENKDLMVKMSKAGYSKDGVGNILAEKITGGKVSKITQNNKIFSLLQRRRPKKYPHSES